MKKLSFIYIFLLSCVAVFSQTAATADEAFSKKDYANAKSQYESLLQKAPKNQLYLYRYARCCQELGETEQAITYFELAGDKYDLRDFFLGGLYFKTYRFEEALVLLENYFSKKDSTDIYYARTREMLIDAGKMQRFLKRTKSITIIDSVLIGKSEFLNAYNSISKSSGRLSYNEVHQEMFTNERGNIRMWAVADSAKDGQLSIVSCSRLVEGWSGCDTLPSPIRSKYNDAFPFVSTDGLTLYFASDREGGCGGYDIYITRKNPDSNTYFTPENLGFPFNSPSNDYMMAVDESKGVGYFATDRRSPQDSVTVYLYDLSATELFRGSADSLRLAAQLLLYDTAVKDNVATDTMVVQASEHVVQQEPTDDETDNDDDSDEEIAEQGDVAPIVTADTIAAQEQTITADSILSELRSLRLEYINTEDEVERLRLSQSILRKERQLLESR